MFSSFSLPFSWAGRSNSDGSRMIKLPRVNVHNPETSRDRRARALKHLLKANHTNHSIIYHNLEFHNHVPHILASAYILGASPDQLTKIYEVESAELEPWHDSPSEISKEDWRDFLGKRNYQRAFVDFLEDQLVAVGYDWQKLLENFLYEGKEPLVNSLISGLGHPMIHLGYAYEISSPIIAVESLAMVAGFYDNLHKYLDDPSYTRPPSFKSKDPLKILQKLEKDEEFSNVRSYQNLENVETILQEHEGPLLDYWNAWDISSDPEKQFHASQRAATALVVTTRKPSERYDFFILHLLTSSHAARILLPIVPPKFQLSLIRQWWLFTLIAYTGQLRPHFDLSVIETYALEGRGWKDVEYLAVNGEHAQDAHFVKGCRAMMNAAETWGDKDEFYLKAAVKFATEFDGWGGFGAMGN